MAVTARDDVIRAPSATALETTFLGPAKLEHGARVHHSAIGRYFSLGEHSSVLRSSVGPFCSIGAHVAVNPFTHPLNWLAMHEFQYHAFSFAHVEEYRALERLPRSAAPAKRLAIGADVWIGHNAIVLSHVGTGAAIGAGAVVTKPVPPYAIVAGNPARILRYRFSDEAIARLLRSAWWERPLEQLSGLPFDQVDKALEILEKQRGGVDLIGRPQASGPEEGGP